METLSWVSLVWRPWEEQFFLHTVDSFRFQNKIHIKNRHISPSVQTQLAYSTLVPLVTGALLMNGGKLSVLTRRTGKTLRTSSSVVRRSLTPSQEVSHRRRQCWSNNLLFVMRENWKKTRLFSLLLHISSPCEAWLVPKPSVPAPWCVCVCLCLCMCSVRSSHFFFFLPSILSVCPSHTVIKSPSLFTHTHTHTLSLYLCSPSLPACLPLFFFFFFPASRSPCPWLYDREKCVYKTHSLTDQTTQMNQKTLARGESGRKEGRKRRRQKESRGCVEAL